MISRRSLLSGILASRFAPAIVGSGILMPVKKVVASQIEWVELKTYLTYDAGVGIYRLQPAGVAPLFDQVTDAF